MKCPHCEYEYKYSIDYKTFNETIVGDKGNFFKSPLDMRQEDSARVREVFGCPNCFMLFLEHYE